MNTTTPYISIKEWADDDKPREKLVEKGRFSLSNAELLAILLGSGSRNESALALAQRILSSVNNDLDRLGDLTILQLQQFKGVGVAKAVTIAAALELGRRRRELQGQKKVKITAPNQVFELMCPLIGELPHEEFWVLFLDNSNQVLHKKQMSKGGISSTIVDHRLILKTALEQGAVSLILAHNHPSGTLTPSEADKALTSKIVNAGQALDIKILDHLIITRTTFLSFQDSGLL